MLEPIQDNDNYKPHAKNIQIYPCLLKLSRKQESVTDRQTDGHYYYKTGRHDIVETLLKVVLKHQKSIIIFIY
jgi:hypothetical protein